MSKSVPRRQVTVGTDDASPAPETFEARTIYGEPYTVYRCPVHGDEWTEETPNDGCESCR